MIIWLASYPRSGNTFFRIVLNKVFNLKTYSVYNHNVGIAADGKTAEIVGHQAFPEGFGIEQARRDEALYIIKTHELPDSGITDRVIYLLRDGRESILSYRKFLNDVYAAPVTLLDVIRGDVFGGRWGAHVQAWSPGTRANTLLVRFEDLIVDPQTQLEGIGQFIDRRPVSREIPSFSELKTINPKFFRRGGTDSWREEYGALEHNFFWLKNHREMIEYGYTDHIPALFRDADQVAALRELVDCACPYYTEQLQHKGGEMQSPAPATDNVDQPRAAKARRPGEVERSRAFQLNQKGEKSYLLGDFAAARMSFEAAVAEDPKFSTAYNNLAVLFWAQGNPEAALAKLADGLEHAPEDRDLVVNGGQMLAAIGCVDEAGALYVRYLRSSPNDMEVRALLAGCGFDNPMLNQEATRSQGLGTTVNWK